MGGGGSFGQSKSSSRSVTGPKMTPEMEAFRGFLGPIMQSMAQPNIQPSAFQSTVLPALYMSLIDPSFAPNPATGEGPLAAAMSARSGAQANAPVPLQNVTTRFNPVTGQSTTTGTPGLGNPQHPNPLSQLNVHNAQDVFRALMQQGMG